MENSDSEFQNKMQGMVWETLNNWYPSVIMENNNIFQQRTSEWCQSRNKLDEEIEEMRKIMLKKPQKKKYLEHRKIKDNYCKWWSEVTSTRKEENYNIKFGSLEGWRRQQHSNNMIKRRTNCKTKFRIQEDSLHQHMVRRPWFFFHLGSLMQEHPTSKSKNVFSLDLGFVTYQGSWFPHWM